MWIASFNRLFFKSIFISYALMLMGCAAYNIPETTVQAFDFSALRHDATREDVTKAFGRPGKTTENTDKTITDEWMLSLKNHPDEPPLQNAMHYASVGMYNVLDHPTKTGVNRTSLKLLTIKFTEEEKIVEAFLEDVCYWGCK